MNSNPNHVVALAGAIHNVHTGGIRCSGVVVIAPSVSVKPPVQKTAYRLMHVLIGEAEQTGHAQALEIHKIMVEIKGVLINR